MPFAPPQACELIAGGPVSVFRGAVWHRPATDRGSPTDGLVTDQIAGLNSGRSEEAHLRDERVLPASHSWCTHRHD